MKYRYSATAFGILALVSVSAAGPEDPLDKPPLASSLDYLKQGLLDNLNPTHSVWDEWGAGWIPEDCQSMANDAGVNPVDIQTYNVHYDDCSDAWILCRHKDSQSSLDSLIDQFGRLPVQMRQWVRHVIALPDDTLHAYNAGGNIALFSNFDSDMPIFVHETGHSLDLLGAYPDNTLSSSDNWLANYDLDSDVPDPYSQTNQIENVAQNTVVSVFNENVPGGFSSVEPNWSLIFHQYATLIAESYNAGGLLQPGEQGSCTHRLVNSAPVQITGSSRVRRDTTQMSEMPNVDLSSHIKVIPPKDFHTGDICGSH